MDLRELRYFRTVVDCGSFSRAAVKLMVAQPSLSRQVRALEHELGLTLLHRNARGVTPTEAGKLLLGRTVRLEQDLDGIRRDLSSMTRSVTGLLRVAVQAPVSFVLLPELVKAYAALYPQVELQLVEAFSGDALDKLLAGLIDIAIVDMPGTPSADLHTTPLWVEVFSLFGAADAPAVQAGRNAPAELSEIAGLPMVAASSRHAIRYLVDAAFERKGLGFKPVLEANGALMIFELVRAGLGYAVMPASVFRPFSAFGELRSVPIRPEIRRTIGITVRAAVAEARAIACFRDLAQTLLPTLANDTRLGPVAFYRPS